MSVLLFSPRVKTKHEICLYELTSHHLSTKREDIRFENNFNCILSSHLTNGFTTTNIKTVKRVGTDPMATPTITGTIVKEEQIVTATKKTDNVHCNNFHLK